MSYASRGDRRLWYEAYGAGPGLLLLHGYRDTAAAWQYQIEPFSQHHRVIVMDMPGHGRSDPPEAYQFEEMTAGALAVLDAAGADRVVVAGHSMGGMVAARMLVDAPERVRAVVFNDTSPFPADAGRRATLEEQIAIIEREGMEALAAQTSRWRRAPGETPEDFAAAVERVGAMRPEVAIGCARMMLDMAGFEAELRGCPVPALVVWGSEDSTNIASGSAALLRLLPNSREAVIPGAGHYPQLTHSSAYNAAVLDFLEGVQV